MSTLETNSIGKYSGNNVSIDDALNLKSYDTAGRDALTSVAGDTIYNTTTTKVEYYDGSAWVETGDSKVQVAYVVIGGGASGGRSNASTVGGGGGGAGGYRSSYASENTGGGGSTEPMLYLSTSTNYAVSIGAGGAAPSAGNSPGNFGSDSYFTTNVVAYGGGYGGQVGGLGYTGGSGGGRGGNGTGTASAPGYLYQGYRGGQCARNSSPFPAGGGGGASAAGGDVASDGTAGGDGGAGVSSSITGSAVVRAGGGGGSIYTNGGTVGAGGAGGGGAGGHGTSDAVDGTVNTGGGGGGASNARTSGAGGSGIVILRYPNTYTISQSGLTLTTATDGSDKVTTITAGIGTVSWS